MFTQNISTPDPQTAKESHLPVTKGHGPLDLKHGDMFFSLKNTQKLTNLGHY